MLLGCFLIVDDPLLLMTIDETFFPAANVSFRKKKGLSPVVLLS